MGRPVSEPLLAGSGTRIRSSVNTYLLSTYYGQRSLQGAGDPSAGKQSLRRLSTAWSWWQSHTADTGSNRPTATYTHMGVHTCPGTRLHTCRGTHTK